MKKLQILIYLCLFAVGTLSAQVSFTAPKTTVPADKDELLDKAKAFLNAAITGDIEKAKTYAHESFHVTTPGTGLDSINLDQAMAGWKNLSTNNKDMSFGGVATSVQDMESGAKIAMLWGVWQATEIASNKTVQMPIHVIFVFNEGKIVREYDYYDRQDLMEQLGFTLTPPEDGGNK